MAKHFLAVTDFTNSELLDVIENAGMMKEKYLSGGRDLCLEGKVMALIFEKPSSRTRVSFETAMYQLGGNVIYLKPEDIGGLGKREPVKDLVRVLNGMVDLVVVRTFAHKHLEEMTQYSTLPIINALSDYLHPCQAVADVMTIRENYGKLEGLKVVYIGDGNNVSTSLGMVCAKLGMNYIMSGPEGYIDNKTQLDILKPVVAENNASFEIVYDVSEAVKDADVIYTDTWVSMGREDEKERRIKDFAGFQVDGKLVAQAKPGCRIMHCLPAYRGFEITDEVLESDNSVIFQQAENRLHAQRQIVKYLMTGSC